MQTYKTMLAHYIFVRRDLPVGKIAAMVTHAAGESAARFVESQGPHFGVGLPDGTKAVVLQAKDKEDLSTIWHYIAPFAPTLQAEAIHDVWEGDVQLMAIGMWPLSKGLGDVIFRRFQLLHSAVDNPKEDSL